MDIKTTLAGIITGIVSLLVAVFHISIPGFLTTGEGVGLIAGIGATIIGVLAKDSKPAQ